MLVTTLAFYSAVQDDGQNPHHPEENSNSAAKDEGDSSTFPTTQIHEGVVDAINERSFTKVVTVVVMVTMMAIVVAVGRMRRIGLGHITMVGFNPSQSVAGGRWESRGPAHVR